MARCQYSRACGLVRSSCWFQQPQLRQQSSTIIRRLTNKNTKKNSITLQKSAFTPPSLPTTTSQRSYSTTIRRFKQQQQQQEQQKLASFRKSSFHHYHNNHHGLFAEFILVGSLAMIASSSYKYYDNDSCYTRTESPNSTMKQSSHDHENDDDDSIRLGFWQKKWIQGTTRWHQTSVHPTLLKYQDVLLSNTSNNNTNTNNTPCRVLVTLCGKTVDMAYLAKLPNMNIKVVGVDCSPLALEEFANEHPDLNIIKSKHIHSRTYDHVWFGDNIALLCGDFFQFNAARNSGVGGLKFDAIWDRASLVAIQPSMRESYANVIGNVIAPGGKYLLSTYIRPKNPHDRKTGPPFSIPEDEVRRVFGDLPWVESIQVLELKSAFSHEPWYRRWGARWRMGNVQEAVILITAKK